MNKKFSILFVFVLLFQTLSSSIVFPTQIGAEGKEESIFTDVSVRDASGNERSMEELEGESPVEIHVNWSLSDKEIVSGDIYSISLESGLQITELQEGKLMDEENEVGTYNVSTAGELTATITKAVEDNPNASGTIVVEAAIASEKDAENEELEKSSTIDEEKPKTDKSEGKESNNSNSKTEIKEDASKNNNQTKDEEPINKEDSEEASKEVAQADEEKHGFVLELGDATDLDGNPFSEENLLHPQDEFKLKINWNLVDGHNYVEGDTKTFDLPKGIKIAQEMNGELRDDSGKIVANYTITPDKKVELTFTDFVETHSNVKGWLEIISTLDETEVEVEDGEAILDPIGEEGELRIPIKEGNKEKTIEKNGTPNKGYNADEINWEVIVNKNKTSLENGNVTDILPEGTEYKEGSLKVTKLKVDLYGNILGDLEEVDITPKVNEDGELIIPLGDTNDAYRVEYVTNVTDDEKQNFENNAILKDDELDDISASSTITINRGESIKKNAVKNYNPKTGIIEWEIEFNYNQKDLSDVTLKDTWTPEGQIELVKDSLKFQEVSIDENGNAHHEGDPVDLPDGAELINGEDQFEVTGISTDKAYKVTYQTKVKDRVLDPFDVSNTAGFGNESDGSGTHVGQYYGAKSAGTIDYAEKTIEWTIKVNQDEYPMTDIKVEDTLGEGLTLQEDSIAITVGGESYSDYELTGDNPFTIDFPKDYTTDKEIIITYKTEFDADNVPDHNPTNKAAITWTPEGEDDSITKEVEVDTELNENTKNNDWKNGSYNPETKEITWTIYTNYRENQFEDLIVKDAPQGNQQIVADSVVVKELSIGENGDIIEGDTKENVTSIDEDANTLEVNLGETNKAYKIEYKTSVADLSDIQKEYVNKADIWDGSNKLTDLHAKVGIVKSDTYGEKSGYQDGKQVHWSVSVNLGQQKINDLKLEDTISENQEYLVDSIKVYHAIVDRNGNATRGEEVPVDEYELTHTEGEQTFTIEWKNEVERAFIVDYSTLFFAGHQEEVTNEYQITGDSITEDDEHANGSDSVTISQLSSGGGSGEAGYLIIDKIDATYDWEENEIPDTEHADKLAGAEFDLIDADTGNVLKSGTTDENGQIDFGRLLFGEYELHERVVPEGYVTNDERQTIVIDKKYEPGDEKESFVYKVLNFEPIFAIELLKTDNDNNALAGAEFTLFDSEDNEIAKDTTDEDGKILFEDIEDAGNYYIQETKAPEGFVTNTKKYYVTIGEKEPEPVQVSVQNMPRGTVLLTKVDKETDERLAGVEFELQKLNDSDKYETVEIYTTDKNGQIETSNTLEAGKYRFVEVKGLDGYRINDEPIEFEVDESETERLEFTMENEKSKGSINLIKKDAATGKLLKGAEFNLIDSEGEVVQKNLITNDDGEIVIDDLLLGAYQLIETKAPAGYELDETPIEIEITEDLQVVEKTMTNHKLMDVSVEKKWNNAGGETIPVTVKLLPTDQTVELNEENDWQAIFEDLRVYDESGEKIDYQVEELDVDGYKSTVSGDSTDGFIITNTEITNVSGEKTWLDDESDERPDEITVKLLANGHEVNIAEVNEESDWKYEFTDLEKYDESGEKIIYTIDEVAVEGYETIIDDFNITNVRVGETEVKGTKTWLDDNSNERPVSITIHLLANGEQIDSVDVTAETNWEYAFTKLPKYDDQGAEITYTIDEEAVEGYEKSIDGYDITNVRVGTMEVEVNKTWKDEKRADRPDVIKVNLLQNGHFYEEYEVTEENDWKLTIADLPKYDEAGVAYDYTVTEHDVPGYAGDIDGFEIINTRSETKDIEITKTWLDDDSSDRPDSIEVELFRSITGGDRELVDTITITKKDNWLLELTDLPSFDSDGKAYMYEINEQAIEGYETKINGFDITNVRVGETEVKGTKTWLDDNSNERPESITIHLLANGEQIDSVDVTAETNWEYAFTKLPKYDDQGAEITYTIDEEAVEGYEKSIDGYDITNVRVGTISVEGTKTWKGDNAKDRPQSIKVDLLQNGKVVDTIEVTDKSDWKYSFTDLEKYDENGVAYTYTVKEHEVEGYESTVKGYDITNTFIEDQDSDTPTGSKPDPSDNSKDPIQKEPVDKNEDPALKKPVDKHGKHDGQRLPTTATNIFNLLLIGFGLIAAGAVILFVRRKKA